MNVLMVGVSEDTKGGMWTVVDNYIKDPIFCEKTNLVYVPTATVGSIKHRILFMLRAFSKIRKILKKQSFDIVHIHVSERGRLCRKAYVARLAKKKKCKVIFHLHGADFEVWYRSCNKRVQKYIRKTLNIADNIIILGDYWRGFISELLDNSDKLEVLYNAVFLPNENRYDAQSDSLLFLGALIERKGIFDLLNAIKLIDQDLPDTVHLLVCGEDTNQEVLRYVKELDLSHRVILKGWVKEKSDIFTNTCLNILPSYHEGLPMTILETMAYGIPNISTNVAAIPEAISEQEGVLLPPGSVTELANAIKSLLGDTKKRVQMSNNCYMKIKQHFSYEVHRQVLLDIYEKLLQGRKGEFR